MADLSAIERVIVAHNPVGDDDDPSTADVLAQVALIESALADLGLDGRRLPVAGWRAWEGVTPRRSGTLVFNLVEAPPGLPAVHPATASAFERLGVPFTGSDAACLWLTTDKIATRDLLAARGLPVAPGGCLDAAATVLDRVPPPWLVKPSCEDASLGLDGDTLCTTREVVLRRAADLAHRFPRQRLLVEHYLPGRELNVSLLAGGGGVTALPVAEIEFVDFPPDMPRIVGYEAKWHPQSFAYTHTVRRFPDDAASARLLARARRLALAAWHACGLAGYGRVDFRVDAAGTPCILEVNANPCLAADAGFVAAAREAGIAPTEVVSRILAAALARHRQAAARAAAAQPQPAAILTQPQPATAPRSRHDGTARQRATGG